jgi:hypothetical protein
MMERVYRSKMEGNTPSKLDVWGRIWSFMKEIRITMFEVDDV